MPLTAKDRERIRSARSEQNKLATSTNGSSNAKKQMATYSGAVKKRQEGAAKTGRVPQHGTVNEYSNYGCRCDECKTAQSDHMRRLFQAPCVDGCGKLAWRHGKRSGRCRSCSNTRRAKNIHGTESMYKRGCHCDECRTAASKKRVERLKRQKANTNT